MKHFPPDMYWSVYSWRHSGWHFPPQDRKSSEPINLVTWRQGNEIWKQRQDSWEVEGAQRNWGGGSEDKRRSASCSRNPQTRNTCRKFPQWFWDGKSGVQALTLMWGSGVLLGVLCHTERHLLCSVRSPDCFKTWSWHAAQLEKRWAWAPPILQQNSEFCQSQRLQEGLWRD